ncbi:MAG: hypothetical protein H6R14_766 [Proteobacteria bacterium]|nr:hypothetical protein [Pseudomonadota bacterium]
MSITVVLDPPSRQDKPNFSTKSDKVMADLVLWTEQANDLAAEVNAREASAVSAAGTASSQAAEATAARDIAMAAVNYKGLWSSLSGSLSIPASVKHGSSIWMLTESVANVATEQPGVSTKWENVTPASGLGSAAYANTADFQPAIGVLTGILMSAGGGNISAATAAQLVAAIGSTYVANATHASSADSANVATSVMDGAINAASKIANSIITWAKMVNIPTGRLLGRGSSGAGSVEELGLGTGLAISGGNLNCTVEAPVKSVGGQVGDVTNAHLLASVVASQAVTAGTKYSREMLAAPVAFSLASVELVNMKMHCSGVIRAAFSVTVGAGPVTVYGYVNGAASPSFWNGSASGSGTFDVSFSAGDTVQIVAYASSGTSTADSLKVGVAALPMLPIYSVLAQGVR